MRDIINGIIQTYEDIVNGLYNALSGLIATISSFLVETFAFNYEGIEQSLDTTVSVLCEGSGSYAHQIYDMLIPIGCMFVFINFCTAITEIAMDDNISIEKLAKTVLVLIGGMLIMDNGYEIMMKIYDFICGDTESLASIIKPTLNGLSYDLSGSVFNMENNDASLTISMDFVKQILNDGVKVIISLFLNIFTTIIFSFFSLIVYFFIAYQIVMRAIKIAIHLAVMPLAISSFFGELERSEAIKHLKKIIALFIQGPIILLIVKFSTTLAYGSMFSTGASGYSQGWKAIVVIFLIISNIIRSEEQAKEMLNV